MLVVATVYQALLEVVIDLIVSTLFIYETTIGVSTLLFVSQCGILIIIIIDATIFA